MCLQYLLFYEGQRPVIFRMFASAGNAGEHNPPHFHAFYQGQEGRADLEGEMMKGSMPHRQQKLIAAWAELRKRACSRMSFWPTGSWHKRGSLFTTSSRFRGGAVERYERPDLPAWWVLRVEVQGDYTLLATFNDGSRKTFDMSPLLEREVFCRLKNPAVFARARVECGGVVWDDRTDIDPQYLWQRGIPVS